MSAAYRLFFPAAGLFAALALPVWLLLYAGGGGLIVDPLGWHMHEMLYGYLPAALAGFLLTAVPNWTGRPALTGGPLGGLFGLWLAGRIAMVAGFDTLAATLITLAFLPALAVIVGRDIIAAGNRRNLVVVAMIVLLWLGQGVFLVVDDGLGATLGFATALILMTLIGGRVTPAFSRNWLKRRGDSDLPAPFGMVDRVAMGLTVVTAASWSALGVSSLTGLIATLAAAAMALRLSRWRGFAVRGEVLLLAQHAAYGWLVLALALMALASLGDLATLSQVRHALGAGAIGTMTIIVMQRAILGHSGRDITGTRLDWVLFAALHLGAALRIFAGWVGDPMPLLHVAGSLWALGMLLFVVRTIPIALAPRV
nr:NnrS family protein [Aliiroseovarius subalbicans]